MPADDPRWILGGTRAPRHRVQLACLPHAGGSASAYRGWLRSLESDVDVLPVQLPGRESRIHTPFATDLQALVHELAGVLARAQRGDLALFGHSMGALLALLICAELERIAVPVRHLVVSGHPGRSRLPDDPRLTVDADADDETLMASLTAFDPGAPGRYGEAMLREVVLPVLRADLRLTSGATVDDVMVTAPITAVAGVDDPVVGLDLSAWGARTVSSFAAYRLRGGHFYLATAGTALAAIVRQRIACAPSPTARPG